MVQNKRSHARQPQLLSFKKNKKGWIRILEATIAVLIVSMVLIVIYSKQVDRGVGPAEYFYSLQDQILSDISLNDTLRLNALNADDSNPDEGNYTSLKNFVKNKIPEYVDFYIGICFLNNVEDSCKMDEDSYIETKDKNVFAEEVILSVDLGSEDEARYKPKILRIYMWEK